MGVLVPVAAEVAAAAAGVAVALAEEDVASEVSVPAAASSVEASGSPPRGCKRFKCWLAATLCVALCTVHVCPTIGPCPILPAMIL